LATTLIGQDSSRLFSNGVFAVQITRIWHFLPLLPYWPAYRTATNTEWLYQMLY